MPKKATPKTRHNKTKLSRLGDQLKGKDKLLIVMQNYPDPDAIASAAGLRTLARALHGVKSTIVHGGTVGRAENRALIQYLQLKLRSFDAIQPDRYDAIAMVDAQPRTGNTNLPAHELPDIVIDHHPIRNTTRSCPFTDVRGKYGATSTIVCEYLLQAGIEIKTDLATALVYGIRSDTQDLGRETSQADIDAYLSLYPSANKRMLSRILNAPIPASYFQLFARALINAEVCGSAVLASVGDTDNPDMIGEIADLLIRKEDTDRVICSGYHEGKALFSIRTSCAKLNAGRVARRVAGPAGTAGGHNGFAGGQIPMPDGATAWEETARAIHDRFKQSVRVSQSAGTQLVP